MVELEIKFQLDAEAVARWRRALTAQGASREQLRAIYVDTDDGRLAQARIALRLRREGTHWVQTLKAEGESAIHRLEDDVALRHRGHAAPALEIARHLGSDAYARLQAALAGAPPEALVMRFETDVRRLKLRVLTAEGSDIEIALDLGTVRAGTRSEPIAELELEHKGGPQSGLFRVACDAVQAGALCLSTVSKAERGERLRHPEPPRATTAAPMPRARHADGATWLRAALRNVLAHILPNASVVAAGSIDPEQIHQLRVGLRRLRTVVRELAMLSDAIDPAWEAPLRETFVRLGEQRDNEAVAETVRPLLAAAQASTAGWPAVPAVDTAAAVRMPALQLTLLHALALAHAPDAAFAPLTRQALKTLVATRLQRLHRQVRRDGRRFDELSDERAHRVRKRLKRLRYLAELAQTLWPRKAVARFVAQIKPAQEALGTHNDLAVAAQVYRAQAQRDPAAGAAADLLILQQHAARQRAHAALRQLPRDKVFWTTR